MNGELLARIRQIWQSAQVHTVRSVNSVHVCANWLIGQQIVEAEQAGAERADYGAQLLKNLSQQLTTDYGSGFSLSTLKYMRTFYRSYPNLIPIGHAARDQLNISSAGEDESIQQALSTVLSQTSDADWNADLGQMQLYVHYYDREVAESGDNPTIGLILCTDKNDAVVRYVLDEKNEQIFASRYQFHLPSEEELRTELWRELDLIEGTESTL